MLAKQICHREIAMPITDKNLANFNQAPSDAHGTNGHQAQHDPFASMGMDVMGPYGAASLPSPDELPGGSTGGSSGGSQPWYLQGQAR